MSNTEPPQWQPPQGPQGPGGYPPPPPGPGGYPPPPGSYPPPPGSPPPPPGGVYPPPPNGGYPPPPGGGYPPPPGGGHPSHGGGGYPPQGGGYGGGQGGFSVGDAFSYGWQKFQANVGTILVAALAYMLAIAAIYVVFFLVFSSIFGATSETTYNADTGVYEFNSDGGGFLLLLFSAAVYALLITVLAAVMQAGIARGVLTILDGRPLATGVMFGMANVGTVIAASLLIGLGVGIGTLLCFIPGLIVAFYSQFYVWFIVDRQLGAIDAIKASFGFVHQNLGTVFIFYLASLAAYFVGALACLIGLFVAVPVVYIAQGYTYRKLQGGYVAP